eukprot:scaffold309755_cov27-Tisochrysis_lutea.AAC.2
MLVSPSPSSDMFEFRWIVRYCPCSRAAAWTMPSVRGVASICSWHSSVTSFLHTGHVTSRPDDSTCAFQQGDVQKRWPQLVANGCPTAARQMGQMASSSIVRVLLGRAEAAQRSASPPSADWRRSALDPSSNSSSTRLACAPGAPMCSPVCANTTTAPPSSLEALARLLLHKAASRPCDARATGAVCGRHRCSVTPAPRSTGAPSARLGPTARH